MTKGRLFYLSGNARSGKSTFADSWATFHDEKSQNVVNAALWNGESPFNGYITPRVVVSGDAFRKALHGMNYVPQAEGVVFATMDVAIRALLESGYDVLIDETASTEETIKRYLRIDINAQPIFVDTPEETCIERAKATGRDYLIGPIKRIASQLRHIRSNWDEVISKIKAQLISRESHDVTC